MRLLPTLLASFYKVLWSCQLLHCREYQFTVGERLVKGLRRNYIPALLVRVRVNNRQITVLGTQRHSSGNGISDLLGVRLLALGPWRAG